jgi:hypothetical protein
MKIKHRSSNVHFTLPLVVLILILFGSACSPIPSVDTPSATSAPAFDHIVVVTLENKEYWRVIGNPFMPTFNKYAKEYTLLTQFYAVTHPSLPNYLAMIGGDTFGITKDCDDCFIAAPNLPDLIETSGRTWKTYQEDMLAPCGLGSQDENEYRQKHNPFVYFDSIRLDEERCENSVVPMSTLPTDIADGTLPNYIFITPNMCNNSHDCKLWRTDNWLKRLLGDLIPALERDGSKYLIVLNWDEGTGKGSCCGMPEEAGGRIAVVLISPLVKNNYKDATPYSHYSLLKTISNAWGMPYVGHAADDETPLILNPWKQ